jgi:hypothetical protein
MSSYNIFEKQDFVVLFDKMLSRRVAEEWVILVGWVIVGKNPEEIS